MFHCTWKTNCMILSSINLKPLKPTIQLPPKKKQKFVPMFFSRYIVNPRKIFGIQKKSQNSFAHLVSGAGWGSIKSRITYYKWVFPKIVGKLPPNHPFCHRAFPLFSPSILVVFPYFWKHPNVQPWNPFWKKKLKTLDAWQVFLFKKTVDYKVN